MTNDPFPVRFDDLLNKTACTKCGKIGCCLDAVVTYAAAMCQECNDATDLAYYLATAFGPQLYVGRYIEIPERAASFAELDTQDMGRSPTT